MTSSNLYNTKQKEIPVLLHRVVAEFPRKWLVEFWKYVLVVFAFYCKGSKSRRQIACLVKLLEYLCPPSGTRAHLPPKISTFMINF